MVFGGANIVVQKLDVEFAILFRCQRTKRHGDAVRCERIRAEDGEFLEDKADIGIRVDKSHHIGHGPFAEAAIVIIELDHGHIAFGIAQHDVFRRSEDGVPVLRYCCLSQNSALGLFLYFERLLHFLDDFRVCQQVFTDEFAEFLLFGIVQCRGRQGQRGRHADEESGQQARAVLKCHVELSL